MTKLKTKGSLTIFSGIFIVISLCSGLGFLPAAQGFNCLWHTMFPQYWDNTNPVHRGMIGDFPLVEESTSPHPR